MKQVAKNGWSSTKMSVYLKVGGHFPADGSFDKNKFTLVWHKPLVL